jgi:hypothetical protein
MLVSLPRGLAGDRQRLIYGERGEVRVRCESVPGRVAVRSAGACQRGRRSKDVTMWRWIGSIKLVVSLLPSAFRLLSMGMRTKKQPMRHHALLPQKFRWHKYGKPEVRVYSSYRAPLTNVRCLSDISISTQSIPVTSTLKRTSASRRFVCCTSFHAKMRQSVDRTICS